MTIPVLNIDKVKIIALDFDDTILRGSQSIKDAAWKEVFPNQEHKLEEALNIFAKTGTGDRYNIIAHIINEPQEGCKLNGYVLNYAKKFDFIVREKILNKKINKDDLNFLIRAKNEFARKLFIISLTPQVDLELIIEHLNNDNPGMKDLFSSVYGSPLPESSKAGALKSIINSESILADQILFIGDGDSDYAGAYDVGTQFIGIAPFKVKKHWHNKVFLRNYLSSVDIF